jgi:hypothetical protein
MNAQQIVVVVSLLVGVGYLCWLFIRGSHVVNSDHEEGVVE